MLPRSLFNPVDEPFKFPSPAPSPAKVCTGAFKSAEAVFAGPSEAASDSVAVSACPTEFAEEASLLANGDATCDVVGEISGDATLAATEVSAKLPATVPCATCTGDVCTPAAPPNSDGGTSGAAVTSVAASKARSISSIQLLRRHSLTWLIWPA